MKKVKLERSNHFNATHGLSKTRIYRIWTGIKVRCLNKNCRIYRYYGGSGIKVCKEWMRFEPFLKWALLNGYQDALTIERINNNGDYKPSNCTWISQSDQMKNKKNLRFILYKGERKYLKEWARFLNYPYVPLYKRIFVRGWSIERSFNTPFPSK